MSKPHVDENVVAVMAVGIAHGLRANPELLAAFGKMAALLMVRQPETVLRVLDVLKRGEHDENEQMRIIMLATAAVATLSDLMPPEEAD